MYNFVFLLGAILSGWNIVVFLVIGLIGNIPTILLYLTNLIKKNNLKKIQGKNDLLCYSSNNFSVRYIVTRYKEKTKSYVKFLFDDGIDFEIEFGIIMDKIGKFRNEFEEMKNSAKSLEEYNQRVKPMTDDRLIEYFDGININVYFYEKLLKKDRKANIVIFSTQQNE